MRMYMYISMYPVGGCYMYHPLKTLMMKETSAADKVSVGHSRTDTASVESRSSIPLVLLICSILMSPQYLLVHVCLPADGLLVSKRCYFLFRVIALELKVLQISNTGFE